MQTMEKGRDRTTYALAIAFATTKYLNLKKNMIKINSIINYNAFQNGINK